MLPINLYLKGTGCPLHPYLFWLLQIPALPDGRALFRLAMLLLNFQCINNLHSTNVIEIYAM